MHFAFAFELYLAIAKLYMFALQSKLYIMVNILWLYFLLKPKVKDRAYAKGKNKPYISKINHFFA